MHRACALCAGQPQTVRWTICVRALSPDPGCAQVSSLTSLQGPPDRNPTPSVVDVPTRRPTLLSLAALALAVLGLAQVAPAQAWTKLKWAHVLGDQRALPQICAVSRRRNQEAHRRALRDPDCPGFRFGQRKRHQPGPRGHAQLHRRADQRELLSHCCTRDCRPVLAPHQPRCAGRISAGRRRGGSHAWHGLRHGQQRAGHAGADMPTHRLRHARQLCGRAGGGPGLRSQQAERLAGHRPPATCAKAKRCVSSTSRTAAARARRSTRALR